MSSSISRFTSSDLMLSLKPNNEPLFIKPDSKKPFLKNKEYAWKGCRNLTTSKNLQPTTFIRRSNVSPPPEPPLPSGSPSGSLRNWIVGIVLTFVLPFFTHKWGSLLLLKTKVDKKIETTEHVVKTIEIAAEKVDKVIDSITDNLPKDSKLKEALEFVDEIAEGVAKSAHVADELINKVEEAEDKLESLITHENSKGGEIPQDDKDKEDQEITEHQESDENVKEDQEISDKNIK